MALERIESVALPTPGGGKWFEFPAPSRSPLPNLVSPHLQTRKAPGGEEGVLIFPGKFFKIKPTPKIILTGRALGVEKESVGLDERKSHEKSAVDCILKRWGKVFSFGL